MDKVASCREIGKGSLDALSSSLSVVVSGASAGESSVG